jgi:hypothetical protein
MNGAPEVNPLRIIPRANDFSYSRPKSCPPLTVVGGLLVCALSVVATYRGKANPTSGGDTPCKQELTTIISKTHRSFASVFLAFSLGLLLFGCATTDPFPHSVTQATVGSRCWDRFGGFAAFPLLDNRTEVAGHFRYKRWTCGSVA